MKWFVDTNVWLSGMFGRGLCAELLAEWVKQGAVLSVDEQVLAEFTRIAAAKFRVDPDAVEAARRFIVGNAKVADAPSAPEQEIPDSDDGWIVSAALGSGADAFVTGDRVLLGLDSVRGMAIIDPRGAFMLAKGLNA